MKTLLLMKHAESSWNNKHQDDWFRPLTERGRIDATQIGELLVAERLIPDVILTSSALRVQQTARLMAKAFDRRYDWYSQDELYLAEMEVYFKEIQRIPDKVKTLLVIGHGPHLCRLLQVITEKMEFIPHSGVAQVKVNIDSWKDFRYDVRGDLVKIIKSCSPLLWFQYDLTTKVPTNLSI